MKSDKIIVIGGGPSGSSVASFLALKGHKVLLFEKEKFPRPHVGESLLPFNYHLFNELGVLDTMEKTYHRKPGVKFTNSDGSSNTVWYFNHSIKDPSSLSFHVDRAHFDNMLLDRTKELGVEVIEETTVKEVKFNQENDIVKVSTRNKEGVEEDYYTKFIIDASGQSTFLANSFNDKKNYEGLERVAINSHWQNPTYDKELEEGCIEIIHLGGEKMGWVWAIPLSKTRLSVGVVISSGYFLSQRKRFEGEKRILDKIYLNELSESKLLDKILSKAVKEEPAMAHGDYSYYTDSKYGKNFAIIGDASAFLDPIFSSGIYVGMMSAKLVAEKLDEAFTENQNPESYLKPVYDNLDGAYKLIEKLIRVFYDPNALSLSSLTNAKDAGYEQFDRAYNIYHYLLQGDFLLNHKKYHSAVDILKDNNQFQKYVNFIKSKEISANH